MKLGVIGFGKMGSSIIRGVLKGSYLKKEEIIIYEVNQELLTLLGSEGFITVNTLAEVFDKSEVILLAIKPQTYNELKTEFSNFNIHNKVIISIMAGITIDNLNNTFKKNNKYVLAMPNTPATIGYGTTVLANVDTLTVEEKSFVDNIFNSIGIVEYIDSSFMNEIIPANGSFPAYIYYFVEAFASSIEKLGVNKKVALKLLTATLIGSAKMIEQSNKDINTLINDVCSPKGATIEGIKVFESNNLKSIVEEAVNACVNRAKELGK